MTVSTILWMIVIHFIVLLNNLYFLIFIGKKYDEFKPHHEECALYLCSFMPFVNLIIFIGLYLTLMPRLYAKSKYSVCQFYRHVKEELNR